MHQTFELNDSVQVIVLDSVGTNQIESWAGNALMTASTVRLYRASENIMEYMIKQGRYELQIRREGEVLLLQPASQQRPPISSDAGQVVEEVDLRIFMPDSFVRADSIRFERKAETANDQGN